MMPTFTVAQPVRLPSKLALLAQAKVDASKAPRLPKAKTEYLTPIANGSSVTTAITTSYQSLFSLTDPSRSHVIPKQHVVPLSSVTPDSRQSKLAMKIKKAAGKQRPEPEEDVSTPLASPMFSPEPSRTRASPSAFASLLVDDVLTTPKGNETLHNPAKESRLGEKQGRPSALFSEDSVDFHESYRNRARKHRHLRSPDFSPPLGFAFDSPSPDDIVFNARRGTSLGQTKDSRTAPRSPRKSLVK
jgi:hypothetical protein